MPLSGDISTALQLLEHIQHTIHASEDVKLESQTSSDLNLLISVLENPVLRGIVTIQDSLCELNQQLQHHPSILPADFELSPAGDLVLSLPPSPPSSADIYDVGSRESGVGDRGSRGLGVVGGGFEFEDQTVPVATLSNSSSSGENVSSPQARVGQVSRGDGGSKRAGLGGGSHFLQLPGGREGSGDEEEEEEDLVSAVGAPLPQPPITTTAYAMEFQKAIGAASQGRDVHTIKLFKPEGSSLGFSVVGLRSEEKGELGIFVQEIQPTGIAGRDGRLQEGDQILAIDGQPLDSNISHHQAISILQKARGLVELVVARNASGPDNSSPTTVVSLQQSSHLPSSSPPPPLQPPLPPASSSSLPPIGTQPPPLPPPRSPTPTAQVPIERSPSAVSDASKAGSEMVLNTEWAQVEVIDLLNDGSGLGFGIIGGRSTGVVVKTILPTGVADRDGRLQSGDHILQIGDVNLRGMGSEQVAAVLRQSGSHVRLVVARPVEPTSPDYQALGSHAPIVPTKILGDPEELDRQLLQNGYDADAAFTGPPPPIPISQLPTSASSGLLQQGSLDGAGIPSYDYTFTAKKPSDWIDTENVIPKSEVNPPPPLPTTSPPNSPTTSITPPTSPQSEHSTHFPAPPEFSSDPFPAFGNDPFNSPTDPSGLFPTFPDPFQPFPSEQLPPETNPRKRSDASSSICASPPANMKGPRKDSFSSDVPANRKASLASSDDFNQFPGGNSDPFAPVSQKRRDSFGSDIVSAPKEFRVTPLSSNDPFPPPTRRMSNSFFSPPPVPEQKFFPPSPPHANPPPPPRRRPSVITPASSVDSRCASPSHSNVSTLPSKSILSDPKIMPPKGFSSTDSPVAKVLPKMRAPCVPPPTKPSRVAPLPTNTPRPQTAFPFDDSPFSPPPFNPPSFAIPPPTLAPVDPLSPPINPPAPELARRTAPLPPIVPKRMTVVRAVPYNPNPPPPSTIASSNKQPVGQAKQQMDPMLPLLYHAPRPFSIPQSQGPIVADSVGLVSATSLTALEPLPEMEKFEVELRKDAHGLGITIAGYVCEKEELSGIFVKSISEGSAADLCGRIQVNDRIVEVDGRSLQGYTNHGAVEVLRGTGRTVRLCLERYLRGPKYEQLQQAIANSELLQGRQGLQPQLGAQRQPLMSAMPPVPGPSGNSTVSIGVLPPPTPSSPSATSLPHVPLSSTDGEDETTEIEPEGESHTTIDSAVLLEGLGGLGEEGIVDEDDEIGGRSTIEALNMDVDIERLITTNYDGELDSAVESAVKAKWSKIMGPDCEIVVAQLSKFGEGGGLGISLEGTVDVEGGREVRPHHYIRSILPEGPVGRNGRLRSGDELLEVNGCRLLGLNHVEVVANLKELPVHVRMVCARKSADAQPQHRLLIDTAQDRAAFAARSILGGSLQNLLPTTDRLVKAKSDGSLASSSTATATASSAAHTPGATSHAPTTPTNFSSPSSSSAPGSSSGPSGDVAVSDMSLSVGGGLSAKMRSRSLEPLTGLAMWSSEAQVIELIKGERGLGFSILDYQDPMNPSETVIVIRSLVPGGVAQTDGRLVPGDRLLAVNEARLENASLDRAVQALKGAPRGVVRIAVAKPLPLLPASSTAQDENVEPEPTALYRQQQQQRSEEEAPGQERGEEEREEEEGEEEEEKEGEEVTEEEEGESLGTTTLDEHSVLTTPSPSTSPSAENLHELPLVRPPSTSERILSPDPEDEECESIGEEEEEEEEESRTGEGSETEGEEEEEEVGDGEKEGEEGEVEGKVEDDDETSRLPANLELEIKIRKGADPLGLVLETVAVGGGLALDGPQPGSGAWVARYGALVKEVTAGGAVARDGRITPGDLVLSVNHESLRRAGSAQARTILHRAQLLSTDITIKYIPGKAVKAYQETVAQQSASLVGGSTGLPKRPVIPLKLVSPSSPFAQSEAIKLSPSRPEKELLLGAHSPLDEGGGKPVSEAEIVATVLAETPKSTSEFEEGDGFVPSPPLQFRLTPGEELTPFEKPTFAETLSELQELGKVPEESTMTVTKISQGHSSSNLDKPGGSSGAGYHEGAVGGGKSSVLLAKHWGPERLVEILREPNCSLGISIVGGKVDLYNAGPDSGSAISGIFIKNVIPQSPAGRTGELKTGDRILEVDGIDVRHASHERAVEVIRGAGNPVTFLVQSLIQWNEGEDRQNGATSASSYHSSSSWASTSSSSAPSAAARRQSNKMRAPVPPSVPLARTPSPDVIQPGLNDVDRQMKQQPSLKRRDSSPHDEPSKSKYSSSEDESDDDDDARDMEGRILTKKGVEISRASAGNVKRTKEEIEADPEEEDEFGYTAYKIQKKYAPLKGPGVEVVMAALERGGWGLGISLSGHKDRNKMAVFVAGMNPNGSAAKEGSLKVGDEILEVNGVFLHGRCHLNASAVIKGLAGPVFKVVVLRRSEALQELAVKPITQFPVSLDDESPEERFANFKGLRSVTIKKGPQGLGIMIIEGKHAEVGQGIFISDIQEGSAAEQAGLIVGDMILQVNKDVIMGSNYDSTASLLKKTEGVVTLVVCNPNKAKEEEKAKEGGKKEEEKPKLLTKPSSGTTPSKLSPLSSFNLTSIIKSTHLTSHRAASCISHASPTSSDSSNASKKHSQSAPTKNNISRAATNKCTAASSKNTPRPTLLTTPNSALATKRNPSPPAVAHGATKSPGMTPEPSEAPPEPPADPATCEIKPGKETTIEINKENVGLGLSIVGGSDTLLGVIIVHEVYSDGASAKDNRLKPGDQILEVNSVDFRNITHAKALAALRQLPAKFKMTVYRDEASSGGKEEDMLDIMEVELAKKAGKGLGLSIVGRKNGPGVYISDVVKGGAAESDGRLMKGDQIIAVNGQDLKNASQEEAAAVLKTAIGKVTIKLGRHRPRKGTAPEKNTSPLLPGSASSDSSPILPMSAMITPSPSAAMGPPLRTRTIRLDRGPDGLGFSIVGGHGSPHGDLPIYVKTVFDRGSASKSGGLGDESRLHRGDQILAVDGVSLDGRTHQEAVALLKGTRKRGSVTLTIAR